MTITIICGVLNISAYKLLKSPNVKAVSTLVSVVDALGFAKGRVLSRALLMNDIYYALIHKKK